MKERTHLSIRMDKELHDKVKYVAEYHGRSMSSLILYLMLECVRDFENSHGRIELDEQK